MEYHTPREDDVLMIIRMPRFEVLPLSGELTTIIHSNTRRAIPLVQFESDTAYRICKTLNAECRRPFTLEAVALSAANDTNLRDSQLKELAQIISDYLLILSEPYRPEQVEPTTDEQVNHVELVLPTRDNYIGVADRRPEPIKLPPVDPQILSLATTASTLEELRVCGKILGLSGEDPIDNMYMNSLIGTVASLTYKTTANSEDVRAAIMNLSKCRKLV